MGDRAAISRVGRRARHMPVEKLAQGVIGVIDHIAATGALAGYKASVKIAILATKRAQLL